MIIEIKSYWDLEWRCPSVENTVLILHKNCKNKQPKSVETESWLMAQIIDVI